jgi:hypothetical protein
LGNDRFLVLERNNRGLGIGATLSAPDKSVYEITLAGATDVTNINLPASGPFAGTPVTKVAKVADLDANTLPALGNRSPEKWEGLAIGPQLGSGRYVLLAGTDNDYSVTQNGSGTQFDLWMDFTAADPNAGGIQCPIGSVVNCFFPNGDPAQLDSRYALLPGVLHAYTAALEGVVLPVSEPGSIALMLLGLAALPWVRRKKDAA